MHFAAALRNLPIDETGEVKSKNKDQKKKRIVRDETYNNAELTNKKCESLKTGDYCFKNTSKTIYLIDVRGVNNKIRKSTTVGSNQDMCFNDLPVGNYEYSMYRNGIRVLLQDIKGSFRIEKCKSLTYNIKF